MTTEKPLHVVELRTENFKRLSAVTIRPGDDNMVLIGGANAQGKTSLLDSLECALGGGKTIPVEPVRRGARKGRIVVDLGDIVVERTFSPKGTALEIRNADGVPLKSPQALLDKLCSKVAFDPLGFAREEPKKQDVVLKQVLGVNFDELDARREALFAKRRDVKRDAKQLEARLDAMVTHADVPAEEVSVAALTTELEHLRDKTDENRKSRERLDVLRAECAGIDVELRDNAERIQEWKQNLEEAQRQLARAEQAREQLHQESRFAEEQYAAHELAVEALVEPDTAAVREQIAQAGETNRKVRENAERARLDAELRDQLAEVAELSSNIEAVDDTKAEMLASAKFPVPGLGFDETGPTLNGIPLSQCSQAERLRVSVAIGAALNPRVKVMLVRDGSLLDDKSLALLAQLAHDTGSQLWVERVGDRDQSAVIIEDGMVLERELEVAS